MRRFPLAVFLSVAGLLAACGMARADIAGISSGAFTLNSNGAGPVPSISGGVLTLSNDSVPGKATSAIDNTQQSISAFTATFTYQESPAAGYNVNDTPVPSGDGTAPADGITFVLETDPSGVNALGDNGGSLGYGAGPNATAITPSVAFEINLFDEHVLGTNLVTNGAVGTYLSSLPVNINSGDSIQVTLTYDGTNLQEQLLDTTTSDTFSHTYAIGDITSVLGGSNAWVGFTGGTGLYASTQTVSDFSFVSSVTTVPLPRAIWPGMAVLALAVLALARAPQKQT
jgi:hypothetical protein